MPTPKLTVTAGSLPSYISPFQHQQHQQYQQQQQQQHQASKKSNPPWRIINEIPFARSLTLAIPDQVYQVLQSAIETAPSPANASDVGESGVPYAKVFLKLEDLLHGKFFTDYVKRGNVLMLSEGEAGVDNVFSLSDGILRLELSREDYERAGLQGRPMPSCGRKHVKARYAIEYDLRLPSMLHGKKGFERLVWAAKNVLNRSLVWLFVDLNQDAKGTIQGPITQHQPKIVPLTPSSTLLADVSTPQTLTNTPNLIPTSAKSTLPSEEIQETVYDLFEYVDLLSLCSPRVQKTDDVDSFISRYAVPDVSDDTHSCSVRILTWTGLISRQWIQQLLSKLIIASRSGKLEHVPAQSQWAAITVTAHKTQAVGQNDGYTILLQPPTDENTTERPEESIAHRDANDDVDMAVGESATQRHDQHQDQDRSTEMDQVRKMGFHRYLCAEYVDT